MSNDELQKMREVMSRLVKGIDDWNAAIREIVDIPDREWPALEEARELLGKRA